MCMVYATPTKALDYELTEYGVYGTKHYPLSYPIPESFISRMSDNDYFQWINYELSNYTIRNSYLEVLSTFWISCHKFNSPEKLCEDYRKRFEDIISKTEVNKPPDSSFYGTQLYEYSVDKYSWNKRTLKLQCSAFFDITYLYSYKSLVECSVYGDYKPITYLAITDKATGSLLELGYIPNFALSPELRYGQSFSSFPTSVSEDILELAYAGSTINYTCTATNSTDIQMPEYFDPTKHDLSVYFLIFNPDTIFEVIDEHDLCGPVYISTDGFGTPAETIIPEPPVTEPPVTEPPETSYPHYRSEVLYGDSNHDGIINLSDTTLIMKHIMRWDVDICTECADIYKNGYVNINDVTHTLKLIAGWDKPSTTPYLEIPKNHYYGDANGDGTINLSDVIVTLECSAGWWNIGISEKYADVSGDGLITVSDAIIMLQVIAGWEYA